MIHTLHTHMRCILHRTFEHCNSTEHRLIYYYFCIYTSNTRSLENVVERVINISIDSEKCENVWKRNRIILSITVALNEFPLSILLSISNLVVVVVVVAAESICKPHHDEKR